MVLEPTNWGTCFCSYFEVFYLVKMDLKGYYFNMTTICHSGVVRSARLRNLRTGHSHEDVDQMFGRLASFISRHGRNATGPPEFRDLIQQWLSQKLDRPHEAGRYAVLLDQFRDWCLCEKLAFFVSSCDAFVHCHSLSLIIFAASCCCVSGGAFCRWASQFSLWALVDLELLTNLHLTGVKI